VELTSSQHFARLHRQTRAASVAVAALDSNADAPAEVVEPQQEETSYDNMDEFDEEDEEDQTLYFGGAYEERQEAEETEAMRVASRINQALAMKRLPKQAPAQLVETAWYDELGVSPTSSQEELTAKYLELAEDVEERLAYLLEEGGSYLQKLEEQDDADDQYYMWGDEGDKNTPDMSIELQDDSALAAARSEEKDGEEVMEAELVAEEFTRISNLYQILSVPQLRRIYDEGGTEGLALKVPKLRKGLLEPERVLKMAKGIVTQDKTRESLLLRREPREKTFLRYKGKNSIRQVLKRLTHCFHVWCFKSKESLAQRQGTIYTELPEIAVFGRVNSGKSAFLKHFLTAARPNKRGLFKKSMRPGTSKGIDVYCVNKRFTIADTPGYSKFDTNHERAMELHTEYQEKWKPLLEDYLNTTTWLRAAVYVHDIAKGVMHQDLVTLQMLKKHKIPVLLVFTKDDKVADETHRLSRVRYLRKALMFPHNVPHAHYTCRRGFHSQTFKNMLGTMLFGLLSTDSRADAMYALKNELPEIFWDYRDKWVPKKRTFYGKLKKEKKVRTYPNEDKVYTEDELRDEEDRADERELWQLRDAQKAKGEPSSLSDKIEDIAGPAINTKDRRDRWEELLNRVKRR